jgi:hypothetical protein
MTIEADPAPRFIEVDTILHDLARCLSQTQDAIDQRNLDLARELVSTETVGFSLNEQSMLRRSNTGHDQAGANILPLSSMVAFPSYRITELLVEFSAVTEPGPGAGSGRDRLHVVSGDPPIEGMRLVRLKVTAGKPTSGKFEIIERLPG